MARWSRGMILASGARGPGSKSLTSPPRALEPLFSSSISPCCLLWANRTPPSSKASAVSARFQACISPIFLVPRLQFKLVRHLARWVRALALKVGVVFEMAQMGCYCRVAFCG